MCIFFILKITITITVFYFFYQIILFFKKMPVNKSIYKVMGI